MPSTSAISALIRTPALETERASPGDLASIDQGDRHARHAGPLHHIDVLSSAALDVCHPDQVCGWQPYTRCCAFTTPAWRPRTLRASREHEHTRVATASWCPPHE